MALILLERHRRARQAKLAHAGEAHPKARLGVQKFDEVEMDLSVQME
jgi:hypothetical protein